MQEICNWEIIRIKTCFCKIEIEKHQTMKKSYCPIDTFINVVKGKRKATIILHLSQGDKRYSELVRLLTDISERMLTKQLKELEADGLISRTVFPEVPPRVEYKLTTMGKEIHPILKSMFKGGVLFEKTIENKSNL